MISKSESYEVPTTGPGFANLGNAVARMFAVSILFATRFTLSFTLTFALTLTCGNRAVAGAATRCRSFDEASKCSVFMPCDGARSDGCSLLWQSLKSPKPRGSRRWLFRPGRPFSSPSVL